MNRMNAGLSILAGGLAFVGGLNASDLIVNGSFELPYSDPNGGWTGYYLQYNQTDAYYAGPAIPSSELPGSKYSWRHSDVNGGWNAFTTPDADDSMALLHSVNQTVQLTNALSIQAIDASHGQFTFSAWLASYTKNPEQPYLKVVFWDANTNQVGQPAIFDRGVMPGTPQPYWVGNADSTDMTPPDNSNHMWSKFVHVDQVPVGARSATVYITRSFNSAKSGSPDTYVDLVKLDVIDVTTSTAFRLSSPADGATSVSASAPITVVLSDIAKAVDPASIHLTVNGATVTPTVQKSGTDTTVQFIPTALYPSLSTNAYQITWSDTSTPPIKQSKGFSFQVYPYVDVELGTALYSENFNAVAEGNLPAGWSVSNQTDSVTPGLDLTSPGSDSYLDWVVISRDTLVNLFTADSYLTSALNVAPGQVINGAVVTNLIDGNFIFANSRRSGHQVQIVLTPDFDLSGRTNVYVTFNTIYAQSEGKLGAVEYSVDAGQSWLPALYLMDAGDVIPDATGNPDGYQTMLASRSSVANSGNFGQYVLGGVSNQWATVAPFISERPGDVTSSQRVELIRLAAADGKATVRVRFTQIGRGTWFFGLDNFGLYSLPKPAAPLLVAAPNAAVVGVGNSTRLLPGTPLGVGPFSYQWLHNGTNVPGRTNQSLAFPSVDSRDQGTYQVVVSNAGGSVTSTPPTLLTVLPATAHVTGQWDFSNGDLRATVGRGLEFYDSSVQSTTQFGTTTSFGIPDINGTPTPVMYFTPTSGNAGNGGGSNPTTDAWGGYIMYHGASANGGGTNVNQYTLIFDVLYPTGSDQSWRSIIKAGTNAITGGSDSEYYFNLANGVGISGIYDGSLTPGTWHRVALAVDIGGPGPHPVVEKFFDGVKVGEQTSGLSDRDGRFSLNPSLSLLFAENNGYNNDTYVSSVQFLDGRLSDAAIASLGGPSPTKIPGGLEASINGGKITISWSGAILESATSLTGPWTVVPGAAKPYTVATPNAAGTFYRSR